MSDPMIYVHNAIACLASTSDMSEPFAGVAAGSNGRGTRMVLRRKDIAVTAQQLLDNEPPHRRITVEDSFSVLDGPVADGVAVRRMPVMVRDSGPVGVNMPHGVTVTVAADLAELAIADRVIVNGFPVAPPPADRLIPQSVLRLAEWKVWLARRDGVPACAGYTYDDGAAVGVYLLATLPEHRGAGLGRAVMTAAIAAHPNRPITLVATEAGVPLYRSLGFVEVSTATWYIRAIVD